MKFDAFNTGQITGKVKTYADTRSFSENVDINIDLDYDVLAFSFKHREKGDILDICSPLHNLFLDTSNLTVGQWKME